MQQLSLFPEENNDPRAPISTNWNLWHGCTKVSAGCLHCYMYRRDEAWEHVIIAVTCEDQEMADKRLPIYLSLPLFHHSVMIEPMLTAVDLHPFIEGFRASDGSPVIKHVSVGGESGPNARPCEFSWVERVHEQCAENGISFYYHQTGAKLVKDGKLFRIPRKLQHSQAHKAGLDISV